MKSTISFALLFAFVVMNAVQAQSELEQLRPYFFTEQERLIDMENYKQKNYIAYKNKRFSSMSKAHSIMERGDTLVVYNDWMGSVYDLKNFTAKLIPIGTNIYKKLDSESIEFEFDYLFGDVEHMYKLAKMEPEALVMPLASGKITFEKGNSQNPIDFFGEIDEYSNTYCIIHESVIYLITYTIDKIYGGSFTIKKDILGIKPDVNTNEIPLLEKFHAEILPKYEKEIAKDMRNRLVLLVKEQTGEVLEETRLEQEQQTKDSIARQNRLQALELKYEKVLPFEENFKKYATNAIPKLVFFRGSEVWHHGNYKFPDATVVTKLDLGRGQSVDCIEYLDYSSNNTNLLSEPFTLTNDEANCTRYVPQLDNKDALFKKTNLFGFRQSYFYAHNSYAGVSPCHPSYWIPLSEEYVQTILFWYKGHLVEFYAATREQHMVVTAYAFPGAEQVEWSTEFARQMWQEYVKELLFERQFDQSTKYDK